MNLASILPPAAPATGTAAGAATADAPTGFLDVLTGKMGEQGGDAAAGEQDDDPSRTDAVTRQDVLTLAALASRSVHATMPVFTAAPTATTEAALDTVAGTGTALVDAEAATSLPVVDAPTSDIPASDIPATEIPATETPATGIPAGEVPVDGATGDGGRVVAAPVPAAAERSGDIPAGAQARSADAAAAAAPASEGDLAAAGTDRPAAPAADARTDAPTAARPGTVTAPGATTTDAPTAAAPVSADATAPAATGAADVSTAAPAAPDRQATTAAAERPRVRIDAAAPTTDADPVAATDAAEATAPSAPTTGVAGRTSLLAPSAAAQRVLDIVEQLEDAPPPRVMVIETGEIRVRVGLDAGTVRLTVLGQLSEAGEEVLREAADALEAGGFGTELDRSSSGDTEDAEPDPWHTGAPLPTDTAAPTAPTRSRQRAGLQL